MDAPGFLDALAAVGIPAGALDPLCADAAFGLYVDHVETGCVYANAELLRQFDLSWEEFKGFGWARSVHPEDAARLRDEIARFEHERGTIDVRYRVLLPEGNERVVHARVTAYVDDKGQHLGAIGTTRDVTAESRFEQHIRGSQKLEAIGRLSGRVAHDFNNVLAAVLASASMLEYEPLTDEGRDFLSTIHEAVDHARSITTQLLSLAQSNSSAGACTLDVELRAMQPLLGQILGEGITVDLNLAAADACVALPRHELGQVIVNLCLNGRDAMGGSGIVMVSTRRDDPSTLRLEVADQGPGIPLDVQAKMFEPFFTTKEKGRGTGLGLATVRDLVHKAGGEITLESQLGRGTRLLLGFPVVAPRTDVPLVADEVLELRPLRVLLADDNDALRQSLAYALAVEGHTVTAAATVEAAREHSRAGHFDVLVTDVLITDGNGDELARSFSSDNPSARVVFITGYAGERQTVLDHNWPTAPLLTKPFHPDALLAAIATAFRD